MAGKGRGRNGKTRRADKDKKDKYVRFTVDLWVTDLNPTEIGIYQRSRHMAKSRQFTKDMDIFASVETDEGRTGLLGFRKKLWKKNTGMEKRLVIKLFTAEMNWRATLDLMLARSLQLTHGAGGFPVTAFAANVSGHDQVIHIERSAYKWVGAPERFSFFILRDGRPRFYRLKRDWINIGDDYTLYDEHEHKVGKLEGKVLNIGGEWDVRVLREHADGPMIAVLQLFCGMLRFNDECRWHLEDLVDDLHAGKFVPKIEAQETDLYMNPRRMR